MEGWSFSASVGVSIDRIKKIHSQGFEYQPLMVGQQSYETIALFIRHNVLLWFPVILNGKLRLYSSVIIIITLEGIKHNKIKMFNQNYMQQYYILYTYSPEYQAIPVLLSPEQYNSLLLSSLHQLKIEQTCLIADINTQSEQRQRLEVHNVQLRDTVQGDGAKSKRRYRKRRTWLQKKYRCNIKGCSNKYSSKIALNSHKRKKHPKRGREMI